MGGEMITLLLLPCGTEKCTVIPFRIPCQDRKSIFEQLFVSQPSFGLFAWETHGCSERSLNGIYIFMWSLRGLVGISCIEPLRTCSNTLSKSKHSS